MTPDLQRLPTHAARDWPLPVRGSGRERLLKSLLCTDVVESTQRAAWLGDKRWHFQLDQHDTLIRNAICHWGGQWVRHTGDGALVAFDTPARALRCAEQIRQQLRTAGLIIRAGVHTGELEERDGQYCGTAVRIVSSVMQAAAEDEICASRTVCDLVLGSTFVWSCLGDHTFPGVPGTWAIYRLEPSG